MCPGVNQWGHNAVWLLSPLRDSSADSREKCPKKDEHEDISASLILVCLRAINTQCYSTQPAHFFPLPQLSLIILFGNIIFPADVSKLP